MLYSKKSLQNHAQFLLNFLIHIDPLFLQVLLTGQEVISSNERRGLTSTMNDLLEMRMIPIINGNDVVAPPKGGVSIT